MSWDIAANCVTLCERYSCFEGVGSGEMYYNFGGLDHLDGEEQKNF